MPTSSIDRNRFFLVSEQSEEKYIASPRPHPPPHLAEARTSGDAITFLRVLDASDRRSNSYLSRDASFHNDSQLSLLQSPAP